jgi:hypothetical protein
MTDPIERLRAVGEGATAGPWMFATDKGAPQYVQLYSACEEIDEYNADVLRADDGADLLIGEPDATFIATARNCWEELVAVAEEADYMIDSFGYEVSDELIEARDRLRAKVESLGEAQ